MLSRASGSVASRINSLCAKEDLVQEIVVRRRFVVAVTYEISPCTIM